MKTYTAYDVNPRRLYKELLDAGQPIVGIRIHGPATTTVPLAVLALEDAADEQVVTGILGRLSGPKHKMADHDKIVELLSKKLTPKKLKS